MDRIQGIERREFLVRFSLLTASAAATLMPHPACPMITGASMRHFIALLVDTVTIP